MKIRILNNSLRLRLSQKEVSTLQQTNEVQASIQFGKEATQHLVYQIKGVADTSITAQYETNQITVYLPIKIIEQWASSDQISIRHETDIGNEQKLKILVEKDFKCLATNRGEDESDLFAHPKTNYC